MNTYPKSLDLMQNTSLLLNNPLRYSTIKLRRIKILKQVLENYRFCRNSGNDAYSSEWSGGWSSCLRHYDALRTKIDMCLAPNVLILKCVLIRNISTEHYMEGC